MQDSHDDDPALVAVTGPARGRRFHLREGVQVVGREPGVDLHLADEDVSRRHARLTLDSRGLVVEDLGSKNGVFVRGVAITGPTRLLHGDQLELGTSTLELDHPASRLTRVLAEGGEMTATRTRAVPAEAEPPSPSLLWPVVAVLAFAALLLALLTFG